jgi:hypothetical protein
MGRLTEAKKATSNVLDKVELARTRTHFTIVDIDQKDGEYNGKPTIQWKLQILIDGADDLKDLYLGGSPMRDGLMLHLQDCIAKEGPIENCYLWGRKNAFGNTSWILGEVGDKDYNAF